MTYADAQRDQVQRMEQEARSLLLRSCFLAWTSECERSRLIRQLQRDRDIQRARYSFRYWHKWAQRKTAIQSRLAASRLREVLLLWALCTRTRRAQEVHTLATERAALRLWRLLLRRRIRLERREEAVAGRHTALGATAALHAWRLTTRARICTRRIESLTVSSAWCSMERLHVRRRAREVVSLLQQMTLKRLFSAWRSMCSTLSAPPTPSSPPTPPLCESSGLIPLTESAARRALCSAAFYASAAVARLPALPPPLPEPTPESSWRPLDIACYEQLLQRMGSTRDRLARLAGVHSASDSQALETALRYWIWVTRLHHARRLRTSRLLGAWHRAAASLHEARADLQERLPRLRAQAGARDALTQWQVALRLRIAVSEHEVVQMRAALRSWCEAHRARETERLLQKRRVLALWRVCAVDLVTSRAARCWLLAKTALRCWRSNITEARRGRMLQSQAATIYTDKLLHFAQGGPPPASLSLWASEPGLCPGADREVQRRVLALGLALARYRGGQ